MRHLEFAHNDGMVRKKKYKNSARSEKYEKREAEIEKKKIRLK